MTNKFKIYRSSAGSGKTFTLVKEYLCLVLRKPDEYKHILALTFTNKATDEMKSRIIEALIRLSKDEDEPLKKVLTDDCLLTDISRKAQQALDLILHDYSNFSVCTIDSFFNRIIRSLSREMQLHLRTEVVIDQDEVISDITSQLLQEISSDPELLEWLTDFAIQKLSDDKGWNIEREIRDIAKELFRENAINENPHSRDEIKNFLKNLQAVKSAFEGRMKSFGSEGMKAITGYGLEIKDFAYGEKGAANYFNTIRMHVSPEKYSPGKRAMEAAADAAKWFSKSSPKKKEIQALAESTLQPLLQSIFLFMDNEFPVYLGAVEVLKRIFLLGIVDDLGKKLMRYRAENNVLLISDTPKILGKFISEEEAPFVYEKSGTRYHHFLIDEFQDTSNLQWKNLLPLVLNSLGSGNFGMVVGDVKQSIYRWRGGNMNLIHTEIEKHLHRFRSIIFNENLKTNFRSRKTIVDFNNSFFSAVPGIIKEHLEPDGSPVIDGAYSQEVEQLITQKNIDGGRVEIHSIAEETDAGEDIAWKDAAKKIMLEKINDALVRGYRHGDIAILVRTNTDGDDIATWLIEKGIHRVVSPDSLLLVRSPEIRFLINALIFLDDNQNQIAKSEILFYFSSRRGDHPENLHALFSGIAGKRPSGKRSSQTLFETDHLDGSVFSNTMPEAFVSKIRTLTKLPLYELCEHLVQVFGLPKTDAYVLRFLELILEYSGKHDASVRSFLNWWNETKSAEKISVITSDTGNAIRIMSIHKSKGLQFPVVIIPFADWKLKPDARDVLWVESDVSPFGRFGKVPVSPGSILSQSCFADSYQNETLQSVTDNINLLYVAFTRAEEELYVFAPGKEIKDLNSTGKLIQAVLQGHPGWQVNEGKGTRLELGELHRKKQTENGKKESVKTFEPGNYQVLNWQDKIRLSLKSDELIEMLDSSVKRAINYGVLVHRVMSSIRRAGDVHGVVEKFYTEGLINEEEKLKLLEEINALMTIKEIGAFFGDGYKVMNEHEILLPDGETLRPDRVLIHGGKAIVIDFKTGKELPSHKVQISKYGEALARMKFTSIEKYLIYIPEKRILQVQ